MDVKEKAALARKASYQLPAFSAEQRINALKCFQKSLRKHRNTIFEANQQDLENAVKENLSAPLLGRLKFDDKKLDTVLAGIDSLISLKDIVGETQFARELTDGLNMYRVTCPIGVLGVIFESRPDALVQVASLCVKSGNAVLLKGGHEALYSNRALYHALCEASEEAGLPDGWIQLCETRQDVNDMLSQQGLIDLIIPRGSNAFVQYIMDHTHIPVMGHADGICHVYVDESADLPMAVNVVFDSKTQNYSVCNAAETLLVSEKVAPVFLPMIKDALDRKSVEIRGDEKTRAIIPCCIATEEDWYTEYLDAVISVKVVSGIQEAVAHINQCGSHHTDAIIAADEAACRYFCARVDSAGVFVNCSTRFSDGFRYGFGA